MPGGDNSFTGADITPTGEYPIPYDTSDERTGSWLEELALAGNTAKLQEALGALPDMSPIDASAHATLLKEVVSRRSASSRAALTKPTVALGAAEFMQVYGRQLAIDANQVRTAITHKLLEIANCGDTKHELRALELLGKHVDIGLFSDKSEVTVRYSDPGSLETAIKERIKRLLGGECAEITPYTIDLDAELGVLSAAPAAPEKPNGK